MTITFKCKICKNVVIIKIENDVTAWDKYKEIIKNKLCDKCRKENEK